MSINISPVSIGITSIVDTDIPYGTLFTITTILFIFYFKDKLPLSDW